MNLSLAPSLVIHSHSTMPPVLVSEPASYRGCCGTYWPATPSGARQALQYHQENWSDWPIDEEIADLAEEQP